MTTPGDLSALEMPSVGGSWRRPHSVKASSERGSSRMTADPMPVGGLQKVALAERDRLLRFLAARGAGADADDLFQELWQRAAATPTAPVADPMSYLFRVAENLVRDMRRSQNSRARRQFDWQEASMTEEAPQQGERALIARERLAMIERTLQQLGPRVASAFWLYRLEGQSQAAIARQFGISLSSVEKDLQKAYRALAQLKAKFDAE